MNQFPNFSSQDFSNQNLRGRSFKGQELIGANFSGADIQGADFSNAILRNANFSHAKSGMRSSRLLLFAGISILIAAVSLFAMTAPMVDRAKMLLNAYPKMLPYAYQTTSDLGSLVNAEILVTVLGVTAIVSGALVMQTILTRTKPAERGPVIRLFSKKNSATIGILAALIALVLVSINLNGIVDTFTILSKTGLYSSAKFNTASPEDDWTMAIFDSFLEIVVGAALFATTKMVTRKKVLTLTATTLGIGVGLGILAGSLKVFGNYSLFELSIWQIIVFLTRITELLFPNFLLLGSVVFAVFGAIAITIGRIAALLPLAAFLMAFKTAAMLTLAFSIPGKWPFQWVIELLIVLGTQLIVCAFSFMITFATQHTSFRGADLTNATFLQAKLGNTNFSKARLENANFRGAKI
jgi:hypothetical protein